MVVSLNFLGYPRESLLVTINDSWSKFLRETCQVFDERFFILDEGDEIGGGDKNGIPFLDYPRTGSWIIMESSLWKICFC